MKLDILAFGAHPDDIEIFCSGTLHKCHKQGKKTGAVDLTAAELSTRGNPTLRAQETIDSSKILKLDVRECLNIADSHVSFSDENRLKIISIIRKYKPDILLLPYFKCRHPDHEKTGAIVKEAAFFSGLKNIETFDNEILQEAFRPKYIFYFMELYDFEPSFIMDITEEFETKMNSIKAYKSQFYDENNPDQNTFISQKSFLEYVEAKARYFGFKIGVRYGEPFYSQNPLPIKSFDFLF